MHTQFVDSSVSCPGDIKGVPKNLKVGHVTPPLDPFYLICIFSVRASGRQCVHKMASCSALTRLRYCDFISFFAFRLKIADLRQFYWGEGWGIFHPNNVSRHFNPPKHLLVQKHVV